MTDLMTMTIHGTKVPVTINAYHQFTASMHGREYSEPSWMKLEETLIRENRRSKVELAIEVVVEDRTKGFCRVTIRGKHLGTGDTLITWADGEKDRINHLSTVVCRGGALSDTGLAILNDLRSAIGEAQAALNRKRKQLLPDHRNLMVGELVDEALAAALAQPEATEQPA